jgi:hypothetical protein
MSNEDSEEVNEVNETLLNLSFHSSFYGSKNKEPTKDYYIKRNSRIIKILWCMLYFATCSILTDGDLKLCVLDGMWIITFHSVLLFYWGWWTSTQPIRKYEHFINRKKLFENHNELEFKIEEETSNEQLVEYIECCDNRWYKARRMYYKQKISEQLEIIKSILLVICVPPFLYGLYMVIWHFN